MIIQNPDLLIPIKQALLVEKQCLQLNFERELARLTQELRNGWQQFTTLQKLGLLVNECISALFVFEFHRIDFAWYLESVYAADTLREISRLKYLYYSGVDEIDLILNKIPELPLRISDELYNRIK